MAYLLFFFLLIFFKFLISETSVPEHNCAAHAIVFILANADPHNAISVWFHTKFEASEGWQGSKKKNCCKKKNKKIEKNTKLINSDNKS